MSWTYGLDLTLGVEVNEKYIKTLLDRSKRLGCELSVMDDVTLANIAVSVDEALDWLSREENCIGDNYIDLKYQNVYCQLRVFKQEGNMKVALLPDASWQREYRFDSEKITRCDFGRVIDFGLNLCADFNLIEIEANISELSEFFLHQKYEPSEIFVELGVECSIENIAALARLIFLNSQKFNFQLYGEMKGAEIEYCESLSFEIAEALREHRPITMYAKKDNIGMKLVIGDSKTNALRLYPITPFITKQGLDSDKEYMDLGQYVKCAIELCSDIPIYRLISRQSSTY